MLTAERRTWIVRRAVGVGLVCLTALAGCGEPAEIIPAGPPGYDPRQDYKVKESDAAEALGEAVAQAQVKGSTPRLPEIPVAAPTAKGEKKKTESGVVYETVKEGTGAEALTGKRLTVHYTGKLEDGKVFDSSRQREPFSVTIGEGKVIKGWEEGLCGMKVGEIRKLEIPPSAGYGALGQPPTIPPNADLYFEVELLDVK